MSKTALLKLIESSKATVMVAILVLVSVAFFKGLITKEDWVHVLQAVVPGWMLAHAGEQGAKHIADSKKPEGGE